MTYSLDSRHLQKEQDGLACLRNWPAAGSELKAPGYTSMIPILTHRVKWVVNPGKYLLLF